MMKLLSWIWGFAFFVMLGISDVHAEQVQLDKKVLTAVVSKLAEIRNLYWTTGREQSVYASMVLMESQLIQATPVEPAKDCEKAEPEKEKEK